MLYLTGEPEGLQQANSNTRMTYTVMRKQTDRGGNKTRIAHRVENKEYCAAEGISQQVKSMLVMMKCSARLKLKKMHQCQTTCSVWTEGQNKKIKRGVFK